MPDSARARKTGGAADTHPQSAGRIPGIAAPALLSFLKQVSAEPSWDAKRLEDVLNVKPADAPNIAAMLEMLGYAEPAESKHTWRNTEAGNSVAGAKTPRFNRKSVLEALDELRTRADRMNADQMSPFRVTGLIAFGDFLDDQAKVQAADVGVGLSPRERTGTDAANAVEHNREEHILAELKAKSALVHLHLIEDWMSKRSHRDLMRST